MTRLLKVLLLCWHIFEGFDVIMRFRCERGIENSGAHDYVHTKTTQAIAEDQGKMLPFK